MRDSSYAPSLKRDVLLARKRHADGEGRPDRWFNKPSDEVLAQAKVMLRTERRPGDLVTNTRERATTAGPRARPRRWAGAAGAAPPYMPWRRIRVTAAPARCCGVRACRRCGRAGVPVAPAGYAAGATTQAAGGDALLQDKVTAVD